MAQEEPSEYGDIFSLIDKMYKILSEARSGFMDQDLIKVSRSSLESLLDELKSALPTQLKSAVEIMRSADARMGQAVAAAESTVRDAEAKAEKIVRDAQERADYLSSEDSVARLASQKAADMIADAKAKGAKSLAEASARAASLEDSADQYCLQSLKGLASELKKLQATAQGGVASIEARQKQRL
ncbi:MAG: hypothetical protein IKS61_02925, partial [Aeriscardovia sp.]|nr:hypothetical protein [Aeriscardovia sp.]